MCPLEAPERRLDVPIVLAVVAHRLKRLLQRLQLPLMQRPGPRACRRCLQTAPSSHRVAHRLLRHDAHRRHHRAAHKFEIAPRRQLARRVALVQAGATGPSTSGGQRRRVGEVEVVNRDDIKLPLVVLPRERRRRQRPVRRQRLAKRVGRGRPEGVRATGLAQAIHFERSTRIFVYARLDVA